MNLMMLEGDLDLFKVMHGLANLRRKVQST